MRPSIRSFNPRARAGRDAAGATQAYVLPTGFNPRARAGRDAQVYDKDWKPVMFQSTRPCGARPEEHARLIRERVVSIHAPVRGATTTDAVPFTVTCWFQSTRPCGARQLNAPKWARWVAFQSTRPCGARLYWEIK